MKVLYSVLIGVCMLVPELRAQTFGAFVELQIARNSEPYHSVAFTEISEGGFGPYAFASYQVGVPSVGIGLIHARDIGRWYGEVAMGPSFDLGTTSTFSATGWIYLESMADEERARGKFVVYANPYYSPYFGGWGTGYMLYSTLPWLSTGIHAQSDGVLGPRVQVTLPKGFALWGAFDRTRANAGIIFNAKW